MLTRGWSKFLVLLGFALEMFTGLEPLSLTDDDEPTGEQFATSSYTQAVEQAPPPVSMPIGHRYVHAEQQNYYFNSNDSWMQGSPRTLLESVS